MPTDGRSQTSPPPHGRDSHRWGKHAQGPTAPAHNHRLHDQLQGQGGSMGEGVDVAGRSCKWGQGVKGIPFSEDLGGGGVSLFGLGPIFMDTLLTISNPRPSSATFFKPASSSKKRHIRMVLETSSTLPYPWYSFSRGLV
jgi:hypothetical protein